MKIKNRCSCGYQKHKNFKYKRLLNKNGRKIRNGDDAIALVLEAANRAEEEQHGRVAQEYARDVVRLAPREAHVDVLPRHDEDHRDHYGVKHDVAHLHRYNLVQQQA